MGSSKGKRSAMGSIDDLGGGRFRIRVTLGYDPETGSRIKYDETISGTRKAAEQHRARVLMSAGKSVSHMLKASVYDYVSLVWRPTKDDLHSTTLRTYDSMIENHVKRLFSDVKLEDASAYVVEQKLKKIEAPGARNAVHTLLKTAFGYAERKGFIDRSPMGAVEKAKLPKYRPAVYSIEQTQQLEEYIRGSEIEVGLIIAMSCALRASETVALDWQSIKLQRWEEADGDGVITFRYSGRLKVEKGYHRVKGKRVTEDPKSESSKATVVIPEYAAARLWEIRGDSARIGPIMLDRTKKRMTPDGFSHRWRKLMDAEDCPVPRIALKNLRHSHASNLRRLHVDLDDVGNRLRHASSQVTHDYYEVIDDDDNVVDERAAAAFDGAMKPKVVDITEHRREVSR